MITIRKYLFVLAAGLFFCSAGLVFADITVAVIAPKAGKYLKAGNELFEGARLAVNEINDNGGLNGEKIDILTIDDRCDDRLAVSTAEMLTLLNSKRIGLVVGPYCSNRFEETAAIYEKAKIFQIVPTTVSYDAASTEKKGQIMLLGTKAEMCRDFFLFYNQNFAGLKVGFVYDDRADDGYADVAKTLYEEFRRYGKGDLLRFYTLNRDEGAYELAKAAVKDKVNIVFVLGSKGEALNFIRAVKDVDKNMIVFTGKGMLPKNMEKEFKSRAEGIYAIDLPRFNDSVQLVENLVNLRLLGIEPEGMTAYSYAAVKLWGDLAREVKGFNYDKLAKAANSEALREKWGDFLLHSGSIGAVKYVIEMYKDGGFKQVY